MSSSVATSNEILSAPRNRMWLFSASTDLSIFLGSALLSLIALWIGNRMGVLYSDTPDWAWVPAVLLIDVAHVYSTAFRVYLDKEELTTRPWLYGLVPIIGFVLGVALYSEGEQVFWRVLAYLAVFHFIRQQYGWVALYRARCGEIDRTGYWIDTITVYAATIYPLIYWHTHLPRKFWWFLKGDFITLPGLLERGLNNVATPLYWAIMICYLSRVIYRYLVYKELFLGKDIVIVTTAICWYIGIVGFNSDYAFTVTNVIIHGVPYLALVYWYGRQRSQDMESAGVYRIFKHGPYLFLAMLWALAYVEELFWDRGVWQDRSWLFGMPWELGYWKMFLVPLLALPQLTHYVLDGFIWRRKQNPRFSLIKE